MGLQEAVRSVLTKYADFSGRARRSEYWYWVLALAIAWVVGLILSAAVEEIIFLVLLAYLAVLVPSLAVSVRRLHDTGRSGWWLLLNVVPFGGLVVLIFSCLDSQPGDNQYGPNPKGVGGYGMPPAGYGMPPAPPTV